MPSLEFDRRAVVLDTAECQTIVMALAKLYHTRPGWDPFMAEISEKLEYGPLYQSFKTHGPDAAPPPPAPDAPHAATTPPAAVRAVP